MSQTHYVAVHWSLPRQPLIKFNYLIVFLVKKEDCHKQS
jgi:hypothetical protein